MPGLSSAPISYPEKVAHCPDAVQGLGCSVPTPLWREMLFGWSTDTPQYDVVNAALTIKHR